MAVAENKRTHYPVNYQKSRRILPKLVVVKINLCESSSEADDDDNSSGDDSQLSMNRTTMSEQPPESSEQRKKTASQTALTKTVSKSPNVSHPSQQHKM